MKNPHLQLKEAVFEISKIAFETDDFFKECETTIEENIKIRDDYAERIKSASPVEQIQMQLKLADLDHKIEKGKESLRKYLDACFEEDGRVEIESPDQEKLDAAFEKAGIAHERIYLVYKHTKPHLLEEFTKIATDHLSPEEAEQFFERVARREAEELNEILTSVESDGNALKP